MKNMSFVKLYTAVGCLGVVMYRDSKQGTDWICFPSSDTSAFGSINTSSPHCKVSLGRRS
jgi:hypothetical protein